MVNNPFANAKRSTEVEAIQDFSGGRKVLDANIYEATIKVAYTQHSTSSNAIAMALLLDVGGVELLSTHWIANKDGNCFTTEIDPKTKQTTHKGTYGFNQITSMLKLIFGEEAELADLPVEEKILKLYNPSSGKEEDTPSLVYPDLQDQVITVAIAKSLEKSDKGRTFEKNTVERFFLSMEDQRTYTEIVNEKEDAEVATKWLEKNLGQVTDNTNKDSKGGSKGTPAKSVFGKTTSSTEAPKKSFFGRK